jgi:hypothetical protein
MAPGSSKPKKVKMRKSPAPLNNDSDMELDEENDG